MQRPPRPAGACPIRGRATHPGLPRARGASYTSGMCGRFTSTTPADEVARYFAVDEVVIDDDGPRWSVAPTDPVLGVAQVGDVRRLGTFRWGLVPHWADSPAVGSRMINARAETLLEKAVFRRPLVDRR